MIYLLLLIYQIKHFVCDYPLQGRYMLGKFKSFPDFILPLTAHAGVHGVATFFIASIFKPKIAFWMALLDMVVHGVVDYIKANPKLGGRWAALSKSEMGNILSYLPTLGEEGVREKFGDQLKGNTYFWWALGADQMAHHLTHYIIIWSLL